MNDILCSVGIVVDQGAVGHLTAQKEEAVVVEGTLSREESVVGH